MYKLNFALKPMYFLKTIKNVSFVEGFISCMYAQKKKKTFF